MEISVNYSVREIMDREKSWK